MNEKEFKEHCVKFVKDYANRHLDKSDNKTISEEDVFFVWQCKILQNNKALLSTTLPDGMYYEITYNGDKKEFYFDAYKKQENMSINEQKGIERCDFNDDKSGDSHYFAFGLSSCYGMKCVSGAHLCIFCFDKNGICCQVFNKQVSEERALEILKNILDFDFLPEWIAKSDPLSFGLMKSTKAAWSEMPVEMMEYIKSLPEFDAVIFKEITGIGV